jgi:uncharacterized protein
MLLDPTFIGTVQDVMGASVTVELGSETVTGLSFVHGEGYRIGPQFAPDCWRTGRGS